MKKLSLLIILFTTINIVAQNNMQWRAVFQYKQIVSEKEKIRRDSLIKAQPAMADILKKIYKRFADRTYILDFNKTTSVYKEEKKLEKSKGLIMGGLKDRILYKNILTGTYLNRRPSIDETFIISDSLPEYKWKISNESKKIGTYTVVKAETTDPEKKDKKITAWFTPELPIGNGPEKYWGLPGFIMEINDGKNIYLCKKIIINPKDKVEIKAPEKGKIVDEETYEKEMEKIRKKMEKMYKNRRKGKSNNTIKITM